MSNISTLHVAAARAECINVRPASDKQINFISSLMDQTATDLAGIGFSPANTSAVLTSKVASQVIGWLLDAPKVAAPAAPASAPIKVDMTSIHRLMHEARANLKWPKVVFGTADIKLSVAGPRAKVPGSINVTDTADFGDNKWFGRITDDGQFHPSRAADQRVIDFLIEVAADPHAAVADAGKESGSCCFCNRTLTDDASLDAGFGATCAKHFGLPHG